VRLIKRQNRNYFGKMLAKFCGNKMAEQKFILPIFSEMATIEIFFAYTLAEFKGCMPHLPKFYGNVKFLSFKNYIFYTDFKMHIWASPLSPFSPYSPFSPFDSS
jgi:hypothetical protein